MMTSEDRIGAHLFSKTRAVGLSKPTALHVRRLVELHAWSVADPNKYEVRWKAFWPRISQLERNVLRLIVETHGEMVQSKGQRVPPLGDVGAFDCDNLVLMTGEVEKELRIVLTDHYWNLVSTRDVHEHMSKHQPMPMACLLTLEGFDNVLRECGLHPDLVATRYQDLLQAVGWDLEGANAMAQRFCEELQRLLVQKGTQV